MLTLLSNVQLRKFNEIIIIDLLLMLQQQVGSKIKDTSLVLMKMYIFICARVQRKNNHTFSNYTLSNLKTLFALLVTHKEKRQSRMQSI